MRILARKGNVNFVKYDNGMYGVEKITKGCSYGMKYSNNKFEVIDFFRKAIETVRRSKNDMNLEIYAHNA